MTVFIKHLFLLLAMDIKNKIYTIRGKQVMLDRDLAELYEVEAKVINQAVKRNIQRFPERFCFKLTKAEHDSLRSQFVTLDNGSSKRGKHRKYFLMFLQNRAWLCFQAF